FLLLKIDQSFIQEFLLHSALTYYCFWEHYLRCDGTPDPTIPQEINTFMSLWREEQDEAVQLVMQKEEVVLNLIEELEFLLLEAAPNEITESQRDQYLESILDLQNLLHQRYNEATLNLLKTASMHEDPATGNMHTVVKDKNTTFCIWVNLKKKARLKKHEFQETGLGFDLPTSLALSSIAVRMMHTLYDHVCPLWLQCQGLPRQEVPDTGESAEPPEDNVQEPEEEKKGGEETSEPAAEEISPEERKVVEKPQRTSYIALVNSRPSHSVLCMTAKSSNAKNVGEFEHQVNSFCLVNFLEEDAVLQEEPTVKEEAPQVVDLQQLVPVGGVYHIDALQLPPQPQDIKDWRIVEVSEEGDDSVSPCPPSRAAPQLWHYIVQITLRLPDNVIYFQAPIVARWNPAGRQWRTDGIRNITYEAEEKSISFTMSAFYTVALLQDAHLNLPFQAWELHPTGVDEGLFTLTAVFATMQIQIKEEVLSHITGKWMKPIALRQALKRAGVNIFPAEYTHEYVPVPGKVSAREFPFGFVPCFSLRLPLTRAKKLKLTETSEAFSEEMEEESEFHSTLYHMFKDCASKEAMDKVEGAGFLFIDSVYQLLLATRVLTYT
uniref:Dynein axonemal intermediate chain 7 n=1 Tax=Malurus cyaneus samueli TaxID=2593467 RepID=A0A8C5X357_9PASS